MLNSVGDVRINPIDMPCPRVHNLFTLGRSVVADLSGEPGAIEGGPGRYLTSPAWMVDPGPWIDL